MLRSCFFSQSQCLLWGIPKNVSTRRQEEKIEEEKLSPLAVAFLQVPLAINVLRDHAGRQCRYHVAMSLQHEAFVSL